MRVMRSNAAFETMCAELLGRGHRVRFRAQGMSMADAVRDGDLLQVERAQKDELKAGEIVLATSHGRWMAHRLMSIDDRNDSVTLRGDANPAADLPVATTTVAGRVSVEREGIVTRFTRRAVSRAKRSLLRSTMVLALATFFVLGSAPSAHAVSLGTYTIKQDGIYSVNTATGATTLVYNGTPFPLTGNGMIAQRITDNMIYFTDWDTTNSIDRKSVV